MEPSPPVLAKPPLPVTEEFKLAIEWNERNQD